MVIIWIPVAESEKPYTIVAKRHDFHLKNKGKGVSDTMN